MQRGKVPELWVSVGERREGALKCRKKLFLSSQRGNVQTTYILRSTMSRKRKKKRQRLWVSLLKLYHKAWSPGKPWKPSQRWASLLCFSWRACFISLSSSSTLTSKLINSRLLFPPLGCEEVSMKLFPSSALDVSLLGNMAHTELWPHLTHFGFHWL